MFSLRREFLQRPDAPIRRTLQNFRVSEATRAKRPIPAPPTRRISPTFSRTLWGGFEALSLLQRLWTTRVRSSRENANS